ncbi:DUF4197 domain-containing protein [Proteobacteria bacterium 005FR1]|nr:DUF4197 domain-containing protein [Proteobacteria bacterium 005FR1]
MIKALFVRSSVLFGVLLLAACAELPQIIQAGADAASQAGYNNQAQMVRGVKEVLELGSRRAADQLSEVGGYRDDPRYRIELPGDLQPIASRLRQFGLGGQLDRVEELMNEGAERAANEAKAIFIDAVRDMTVTDALGIIRGHDTAATEYFRRQTEERLRTRYEPIIKNSLQQTGFYDQYQSMLSVYKQIPLANKPNLDLEQHALDEALDALFQQVAVEERLIRQDPVGRGTAIIESVFGN